MGQKKLLATAGYNDGVHGDMQIIMQSDRVANITNDIVAGSIFILLAMLPFLEENYFSGGIRSCFDPFTHVQYVYKYFLSNV